MAQIESGAHSVTLSLCSYSKTLHHLCLLAPATSHSEILMLKSEGTSLWCHRHGRQGLEGRPHLLLHQLKQASRPSKLWAKCLSKTCLSDNQPRCTGGACFGGQVGTNPPWSPLGHNRNGSPVLKTRSHTKATHISSTIYCVNLVAYLKTLRNLAIPWDSS